MAKEVLASRDAGGDGEGHLSGVGNHAVNTPGLGGGIKPILVYLEPLQASDIRLRRVRYLGTI